MKFLTCRKAKLPTPKKIVAAIKNRDGSAAIEMVYAVSAFCIIILCTIMILAYAIQVNKVSYAAKRITRNIEISGRVQAAEINALLHDFLPNYADINATWRVTPSGTFGANRFQLRDQFTLEISATYKIQLLNPGNGASFSVPVPIHVRVSGQSEMYFKS